MSANTSIRRKVTLTLFGAFALALATAAAAIALFEYRSAETRARVALNSLADSMASSLVASLDFAQPDVAQQVLSRLEPNPSILGIVVFRADADGREVPFARFRRAGIPLSFPQELGTPGFKRASDRALLVYAIRSESRLVGYLQLESDISSYRHGLREALAILGVILVILSIASMALSSLLQSRLTAPIVNLARIASRVRQTGDFDQRVPVTSTDEMGELATTFNGMLASISANLVESRNTQEALRRSQSLLSDSQHLAKIGSWNIDMTTRALEWTDEMFRVMGHEPRSFVPTIEKYLAQVMPEARDDISRRLAEARADREYPTSEYRIVWPDGTLHWVLVTGAAEADAAGRTVRLYGSHQDITARRAAEAARRETEERYSNLIMQARDAIFTLSVDGEILSVNDAFENITGWPASSWMGRRFTDSLRPEDRNTAGEQFEETLRGGHPPSFELQVRSSQGSMITLEFSMSLRMRDGRIEGLLAIGRDVTERRISAEANARLEAQLRQSQKMEAIGALAGGIAHDFNNILTAIIGNAQLATMELPSGHPACESLGGALAAAQRAKELVNQILLFSRRQEQKRVPARLGAVVQESMKLLRPVIPSSIEIQTRIPEDSPLVLMDATQIHQVVVNLAMNAAHAMEEHGGKMEITLDTVTVDEAMVNQHPQLRPGRFVRLWITDTGQGMDEATLKKIFEPFFTTKEPGKGTGLGLAVVHGIVEQHEGATVVYSTAGTGTSFQVFFPVCEAESEAAPAPAPVPMPASRGQRLIIVDDEPMVLSVAERALRRAGYRTVAFSDPTEALRAFREKPYDFDLVISDLTMPQIQGTELLTQMRSAHPGIALILTTGFGGKLDSRILQARNIHCMLQKPFTNESLLQAVSQALSQAEDWKIEI